MVIECSFCSNSRSERYLYTECGHLVCINCAALRAGQTLQCCSRITYLNEAVKSQLKSKKQAILANLQNEYEYERTDVNKIGFSDIQERLRKIQALQNKQKRIEGLASQEQQQNFNQQFQSTPMNQFYKNAKIFEENKYVAAQSTPIKLVSNTEDWEENPKSKPEKSGFYLDRQQKTAATQTHQTMISELLDKNAFIPILQKNIHFVRQNFKHVYDQLQKMEANFVYEMKIYFEEYIKLIEQESFHNFSEPQNTEMQKLRMDKFLQQFGEKCKIDRIKDYIEQTKVQVQKKRELIIKPVNFDLLEQRETQRGQPMQSYRLNYACSPKNVNFQEKSLQQLRISEEVEGQNRVVYPATTGRNLDKIYKKLEESRSKLEERIQIHNQFMGRRCLRMGQY